MRVLFVTPEIADFVSVGGLAAVSAALPRALSAFNDVRVIVPGYREVMTELSELKAVAECAAVAGLPACRLSHAVTRDGLAVYVVVCPALYDRAGNPYGDEQRKDWPDNDIRFARLASVAADLAMGRLDPEWGADLVHCNDWQSALVPAYLAWNGSAVPSVLTIHNLA